MHKLQVTIEIVKLKVPLHKPMEGQEVSLLHSSVTTKLSRTNYWCGLVSRGQKLDMLLTKYLKIDTRAASLHKNMLTFYITTIHSHLGFIPPNLSPSLPVRP